MERKISNNRILIRAISLLTICAISLYGCGGVPKGSDLSNWVGKYSFFENPSPNICREYELTINTDEIGYSAYVFLEGHLTYINAIADIVGNEEQIDIVMKEYVPDMDSGEPYKIGEILFTLRYEEDELITEWGEITPFIKEHEVPGFYFEKELE